MVNAILTILLYCIKRIIRVNQFSQKSRYFPIIIYVRQAKQAIMCS